MAARYFPVAVQGGRFESTGVPPTNPKKSIPIWEIDGAKSITLGMYESLGLGNAQFFRKVLAGGDMRIDPQTARVSTRLVHVKRVALFLVVWSFLAVVGSTTASAGTIGNANFENGFSAPNYGGSCSNLDGTASMGDSLAGQIGSSVFRVQCYWTEYQTGVNQYNQTFLNNIVNRVIAARNNSGNLNMRILINLDLPTENVPWMAAAGYNLQHTNTGGAPRYYPTSKIGQEAYGQAMAKILKYLYNAGVSSYIETPNEPNWSNGIAQAVPADQIGALAAYAVTYAALEGLQQNTSTGPAILVGSVATGQTDGGNFLQFYNSQNPTSYFGDVQYWTDILLQQWWANVPGGPSYAYMLSTTWRPSFHAYPKLGTAEGWACQPVDGSLRQDQKGDLTGDAAFYTVEERLGAMASVITNNKQWWATETGMTSFKTNFKGNEAYSSCVGRRQNGGNSYGKTQQSNFYGDFVYNMNYMKAHSGFPWSRFEGATFFLPQDINIEGSPFAGFGVHWPAGFGSCGLSYPCRKTAATTFEQYF